MPIFLRALLIFIIAYTLILTERINQTVAALFFGMLMIIFGIINQSKAISAIDFNTIGLLIGMIIIVEIIKDTGIFQYLAIRAAQIAKGDPIKIMIYLSVITAVVSAFLDNVTTILMILPLTFVIADTLKISAKPFLISEILMSNIGGAATLIGDPPNILIGSASGLTFNQFLIYLSPIIVIISTITLSLILIIFKKDLVVANEERLKIMNFSAHKILKSMKMVKRSLFVLSLTMLGFICHGLFHLEVATVALAGSGLLLILTQKPPVEVFKDVEWTTIFFIIGMFILVAGLKEAGIINFLTDKLLALSSSNINFLKIMIVWSSGLASAFLGNIPITVTMIPIIKEIGNTTGLNIQSLWWALSLACCLGGNGTVFGSAANLSAIAIYKKSNFKFNWLDYFKIAFPITILSLIIANFYVLFVLK